LHDRRLSLEDFFHHALYSPVRWPWKSVRLERSSLLDGRERCTSPNVAIAELFHENSKLFPQMLDELAFRHLDLEALRRRAVEARATALQAHGVDELDATSPWVRVIRRSAEVVPVGLLYAVEVRIATVDSLAVHEPISNGVRVVKRLAAADRARLQTATGFGPHDCDPASGTLFVVGAFIRNALLYGSRGYRRTLLEAGQVAQHIKAAAEVEGLGLVEAFEFIDRDVDDVLELDGIEHGSLIAFGVAAAGADER
jgi:hypothetical protein